LTAHLDVFPTLAELAGARVPAETATRLEGRSLVSLLENPAAPWAERYLFTHVGRWERGQAAQSKYRQCSVRFQQFELVSAARGGQKAWELYDLLTDPGEKVNLATGRPELITRLNAAYDRWWQETQPNLENENVDGPAENPFKTLYWKQIGGRPANQAAPAAKQTP
jgi:arylsulfatase